ncbi:TetR/AcrR family transcriptional regulator [Amycolatopsis nigrescens]|uniref:TetR/AcrR family transcriptional regulator n=1 Tax=Amycolatopsis nigrescens TaxID=381445 RepID=UPI00037DA174|nr:TetR/AcrR family transcriptional regulator [Amycolatopsis nigrescens]
METSKPLRADARRNYERLLDEAKRAFGQHGVDASLEEIARRAGVGIGTLYRHFPTRNALLEVLLRNRFDTQAKVARELLWHPSPSAALQEWLAELARTSTTYRGLVASVATALSDESSELYASCHAMQDAAARLLARAQEAGEIRAEVASLDLMLLANGVAWAVEHAPDGQGSIGRLSALVFSGLRTS